MSIIECLDLFDRSILAVTGCGGKTSFINLLAEKKRDKKVLISPTTKTYPLYADRVKLCKTLQQCEEHQPQTGVQCLGILNTATGKLGPLPEHVLADMMPDYDLMLLEADGCRGLLCKGWRENEPVIPWFCTHTVGIVTMNALGSAATESIIHRLPEFLSITGLQKGKPITPQALEAMVCSAQGMFKNSAGARYLLVNQVEDNTTARIARSFLQRIKKNYSNHFTKLLYGSVHLDMWQEV
ncbi:MAG: selenium cofactor biosynthesis protein YqeC [Peptococcaceae bacterium]|nr:selenium cofactor biosynthesis protein YqeC [Peptococcaceae bacterium]